MSPSQWITLFVLLYSHLLAPTLPGPLESIIKNPLTKTLGVFWLVYLRTKKWKFSLLVASGIVVALEGSCYLMYGREAFCNFHRDRWCPAEDLCFDESTKSKKVEAFLDDTDKFIKSLYKYVDADQPDAIMYAKDSEDEN